MVLRLWDMTRSGLLVAAVVDSGGLLASLGPKRLPSGIRRTSSGMVLATAAPWSAAAAEPSTAGFSNFRSGLGPLLNARKSILQGTKLSNGACRYQNVNDETLVPPGGWGERTIALDPVRCRKLIEAGTPTDLSPESTGGDLGLTESATAYPPESTEAAQALATSGTQTRLHPDLLDGSREPQSQSGRHPDPLVV